MIIIRNINSMLQNIPSQSKIHILPNAAWQSNYFFLSNAKPFLKYNKNR